MFGLKQERSEMTGPPLHLEMTFRDLVKRSDFQEKPERF